MLKKSPNGSYRFCNGYQFPHATSIQQKHTQMNLHIYPTREIPFRDPVPENRVQVLRNLVHHQSGAWGTRTKFGGHDPLRNVGGLGQCLSLHIVDAQFMFSQCPRSALVSKRKFEFMFPLIFDLLLVRDVFHWFRVAEAWDSLVFLHL